MLYLKEANWEDLQKEYEYITQLPADENGLTNRDHGCSFEIFQSEVLPRLIEQSKGINLPQGHVPCTTYFLWLDDVIIGLYRIRHHLTPALAGGAGHIGFGIHPDYRGKGYATKGLKLTLKIAKELVKEDEIYMSCLKTNVKSYYTQLHCGAYLHHEDEREYYTRIDKQKLVL